MPIYTVTPSILPSPSIKNFDGNLTIDANIEDCNICVMSYNDWGKSFYFSSEMKSDISITNVDSYARYHGRRLSVGSGGKSRMAAVVADDVVFDGWFIGVGFSWILLKEARLRRGSQPLRPCLLQASF